MRVPTGPRARRRDRPGRARGLHRRARDRAAVGRLPSCVCTTQDQGRDARHAGTRFAAPIALRRARRCADRRCRDRADGSSHPDDPADTASRFPTASRSSSFQLRSDVAERGAQVRVINGSDADLVVTSLTFADDWFAGEAVRDRVSTVPAGRTVDLRFALPESACEDEPDAAARTSRGHARARGRRRARRSMSPTPRVHDADPREGVPAPRPRARRDAGVDRVPPVARPAAGRAASSRSHRRAAPRPPSWSRCRRPICCSSPTNRPPFPLALPVEGTDAASAVAVPLVPLRCDPHAVMEDKRGTVFDVARRGRRREPESSRSPPPRRCAARSCAGSPTGAASVPADRSGLRRPR